MSAGAWILLGVIALFTLPILFGMVRDHFGWNSNRFYGDEANKIRNKKGDLSDHLEDKKTKHTRSMPKHFFGGNGDSGGGD